MSFITFDYKCSNCNYLEEDAFVHRSAMNDVYCPECGTHMMRLMPGPITTFKFGDRAAIKSKKAVSLMDKH